MKKFIVGSTTYQRCTKYGVGKLIGGKIYVHKNYAHMVDPEIYEKGKLLIPDFNYNCVVFDLKSGTIRFDEAPDFDTEREPHPGDFIEINVTTKEIRFGHSNMIWHHKWMWVMDDYNGFNVDESYAWSQQWTKIITHPSGSRKIWDQQLKGECK